MQVTRHLLELRSSLVRQPRWTPPRATQSSCVFSLHGLQCESAKVSLPNSHCGRYFPFLDGDSMPCFLLIIFLLSFSYLLMLVGVAIHVRASSQRLLILHLVSFSFCFSLIILGLTRFPLVRSCRRSLIRASLLRLGNRIHKEGKEK